MKKEDQGFVGKEERKKCSAFILKGLKLVENKRGFQIITVQL